jgi:HSP20 family protein
VPPTPRPGRGPRTLSDLLWSGWPGLDQLWPLREGAALTAAAPIPIEEVIEGQELVVRAEIPGVDPDKDIEVTVDDHSLTIKAERSSRIEETGKATYRSEFQYGSMMRRIRLPKDAGVKDVSATYRDGVLEVRMPVPDGAPSVQQVPVNRA